MNFGDEELAELIRVCEEDPAIRLRLGRAIFEQDLAALPAIWARTDAELRLLSDEVRAFTAESRERLGNVERDAERNAARDAHFATMDASMAALVAIVASHSQRFDTVDATLKEHGGLLKEQGGLLKEHGDLLKDHSERFDAVDARLDRVEGRLGNVEGGQFEIRYQMSLPARLGRHFLKVRPVSPVDIPGVAEALRDQRLSEDDWDDLLRIDAAALARRRGADDIADVVVLLDLSQVIDANDLRRAHRRAEIVRRAGTDAVAAVDGETLLPDAKREADALGVLALVRTELPVA